MLENPASYRTIGYKPFPVLATSSRKLRFDTIGLQVSMCSCNLWGAMRADHIGQLVTIGPSGPDPVCLLE